MYWPISFFAVGPRPGRDTTNLRMLLGLWANGHAFPRSAKVLAPARVAVLTKSRRFMMDFLLLRLLANNYVERQLFSACRRRSAEACSAESACLWCSSVYQQGAYSSRRSNSIFNASSIRFCACPTLSLSYSRFLHPLAGAIPRSLSLARLQCDIPGYWLCSGTGEVLSACAQ